MTTASTINSGFQHHTIPLVNERSVNSTTRTIGGVYISYNSHTAGYGCITTAIVLQDRVFFILNGDHRQPLYEALENTGLEGVIDYFIENISIANRLSEHRIVLGEYADEFSIAKTALEVLGQPTIDRMANAAQLANVPGSDPGSEQLNGDA